MASPETLFDSHAHLDSSDYARDLPAVMERARAAGVAEMVTVATDLDNSRRTIELARAHPGVYASVGVHPNDSARFGKAHEDGLRALCASPEVVAIGETGLDYYRDHCPREAQKASFSRQLALAAETGLAVIIHNRLAAHDCMEILKGFEGRVRGVAHCFSGDEALARTFLDIGFYVSFAGPVTFPNAGNLKRIARIVPEDRLLVETDCPWLAPQPARGKRNEPAFVRYTLDAVAQIRGVRFEDLARATTQNARALFLSRLTASTTSPPPRA